MKKYESSLTRDFRNRVVKSPVVTNRFLWHIRDAHEMDDYLIAQEGLTCYGNFAVFAHNNIKSFDHTYPLFLDRNIFWDSDNVFPLLEKYSFWRIDTHLAKTIWYEDPNMEPDIDIYNLSKTKNSYVCSFNPIPNTALKLFKFNTYYYLKRKKYKVLHTNDVCSIVHHSNDFEALLPCPSVNRFLSWKLSTAS